MKDSTELEPIVIWQGRVEVARRFQKEFGDSASPGAGSRWEQNRKAMAGDFNSIAELGDEAVDVNMVRSTMKSLLPPLWLSEPFVTVRPTQPTFKGADNKRMAEATEAEINYWLRELEVRHQVRKVVHDAEGTNVGYLYVGYVKDKKEIEDKDGNLMESVPTIRPRQPFVRRHRPSHVLVPPGYDDLDSAPWVDIIFIKPFRHVVAKYGEKATEGLSASLTVRAEIHEAAQQFQDYMESDDAKFVEVHNVWDKESGKVYIFAEGHDRFLEEPKDWPYEPEGFPLVRYSPEYVPDQYYGTPPINFYLQQNKELNATRTAMAKRRNRTKSVVFMDSALADQVADKYKTAEDGEIIGMQLEENADIRTKMHLDGGLPFDNGDLAYDSVLKTDIREQAGLGAERRGGGDPNVGSATASANIEKGIQIREADRGDGVRGLYIGVAKRIWMIVQQFPDAERTRLIAGPIAGRLVEFKYSTAELKGEFNFDMDFGAMLADTPEARSNRALLNYNLLRADPLIDPNRLIFDVLKTQNTVDPESYMLKLRDPVEEHALISQGLPVEAHERDAHEAHMGAHDVFSDLIDRKLVDLEIGAERSKLTMAQNLILAHMQDHVRLVQKITGQEGRPIASNLLRSQVQRQSDNQTEAELGGEPLTQRREQLVQ